jgi:hypothetical protein
MGLRDDVQAVGEGGHDFRIVIVLGDYKGEVLGQLTVFGKTLGLADWTVRGAEATSVWSLQVEGASVSRAGGPVELVEW